MGGAIADALAEAAMAEFVGAAKEFDGEIGAVGGQTWLHGAVMLVAEGEEVSAHRSECST